MGHIVVFPADKPAVPDKEDLHHRLPVILIHGNDILVLPHAVGDLLLLGHLLYAVVQVPESCRGLKVQLLRRRFHLFLQLLQHRAVIAV